MKGATIALGWMLLAAAAVSADDVVATGKTVYGDNCKLCHGPEGSPSAPMKKLGVADLSLPKWQASRTDDQIRKIVANGKPDTLMRAFKDELAEDDIEAVVKYVRTLGKPEGPDNKKK
jgi:mono/diheme cytochrome c family protein